MSATATPIQPSRLIVHDSGDPGYINRLLIGTPTKGLVRIEWHAAVKTLMVPPNWSTVSMSQGINEYFPVRFTVADAQNIIVKTAVEKEFEWLLLLEDDTIPPQDLFVKLARYMRDGPPIVSALYYTKNEPSEPLIYRGRGNGAFLDWKPGDQVWCDGVPTGCLLIHGAILRAMYAESEPYLASGHHEAREVFNTPSKLWVNPETQDVNTITGTSDLDWCTRVIEGGYFKKAGWDRFQRRKYPFLVDTSIFCGHIDHAGQVYPPR